MNQKQSMKGRGVAAIMAPAFAFFLSLWASEAISASTVPLPPSDVCVEEHGCDTPSVSSGSGIKWHPGHYAEPQTYSAIPASLITDIASVSSIKGVTQRYNWSTLEPERGQYDFSAIQTDLAKLRPHGKHLIVMLVERSWSGSSSAFLPAYLSSEGGVKGWISHPAGGVFAALWRQPIMDRVIALNAALAARFDNEPLFEGMRFAETTMGMNAGGSGVPSDYNVYTMAAQWTRLSTAARQYWKRTNVFFNANSLNGTVYMLDLIEHGWQIGGVGGGGPDVLPPGAWDYQVPGDRVIARKPNTSKGDNAAAFVRDYRGQIPVSHSVQTPELGGKEGTFYPAQLADYAITQVGETHMSWCVAPTTVKVNWKNHILPYLRSGPRQTNQSCPKAYKNGCVN